MISINKNISTPKYKQIINALEQAISNGILKKGDQIPSINSLRDKHKLSRDTVLMAFNELKNRGIIESIVGKGYYVSSENITVTQRIFLLFDELNAFKEDLYNGFLEGLEDHIQVDIFFHHFNESLFSKLIHDNIGDYHYYVIMPANLKDTNNDIKKLPTDKVYILDQIHDDLLEYAAIYQNFEKVMYDNLSKALHLIKNYKKIILIFDHIKQPLGILKGFESFCNTNAINYDVINTLKNNTLHKGDLYVILDDKNLLQIIKSMKSKQLKLAKDIGVISYNDTLLKEIVEGGITTISTNFTEMGSQLAEMLMTNTSKQIENSSTLILRNSL